MRPSHSGDPYNEAGTFRDLHSSYGEFLRRQEHSEHFESRDPYPPLDRNRQSSDPNRKYNGPQRPAVFEQNVGPSIRSDYWRSSGNTPQIVNQDSWITTQPVARREWPGERSEFPQTSTPQSFPRNGIVPSQRSHPIVEQRKQAPLPKRKRTRPPRRKGKRVNATEDGRNTSAKNRMTDSEMEEAAQLQIKLMAEMEAKALAKERNVDVLVTNKEEEEQSEPTETSTIDTTLYTNDNNGRPEMKHEVSSSAESSVQFKDSERDTKNEQLSEYTVEDADCTNEPSSSPRKKLRILDSKFEDVHLYHRMPKSSEPKTMQLLQSKYKPSTIARNPKGISAREKPKSVNKPAPLMSVPVYPSSSSAHFRGRQLPQESISTPHNGPASAHVETDSSIIRQRQINDPIGINKQAHQSPVSTQQQPMNGPAVIKSPQEDDTAIDPNAYIEDLSDLDDDWSEVVSMLKPRSTRTALVPPTRTLPPLNVEQRGVLVDPKKEIDQPAMMPSRRPGPLHIDKPRGLLGAPAREAYPPMIPAQRPLSLSADRPRSLLGAPRREVGYPTMVPPPRQVHVMYNDKPRGLLVTPARDVDYPTMVPPPQQMPIMYSEQPRSLLGKNLAANDDFHMRRQPGPHQLLQSRVFLEPTYTNTEPALFNGYHNQPSRIAPSYSYLDGSGDLHEIHGAVVRGPRGMMRR